MSYQKEFGRSAPTIGGKQMARMTELYPPYAGNEPYLHLCFSENSRKKAEALLRRLYRRGVRVWYEEQTAADRSAREAMNERMRGASLTVVYLDEAFRNDPAAKGRMLACQRSAQAIVCLNTDGGDSGLSIGLHANAEEIRLGRNDGAEDAEQALLHAKGFSQALIGEPVREKRSPIKRLAAALIAAAVLLSACGVFFWLMRREKPVPPEEGDTVVFSDETVREAVRSALGGGSLSEERLGAITTLRFIGDALPETLSDLALLPNLETVEISQTAAKNASQHPELSDYTVELFGGDSE